MPFSAKVFVPKSLIANPKGLARAVANGLDGAAAGALVDFQVTTATWSRKVQFLIDKSQADRRIVGTDDEIYGYVSGGTKPHIIVAHGKALVFPGGGFRPKTRPRYIGSNKGSKGGAVIFRPVVHHPGTEAREFDEAIAEKWQKELPKTLQRAIDSEV
jgi:hypothetical protein